MIIVRIFTDNMKMNRIQTSLLTLTAVLWCAVGKEMTDIEMLASQPTKCTYEYAYEMYGAHCAGLRLAKLPSLRGGIEILDFSDNKLQEIHSDTFSSYSSIRFLYLAENQIYQIDDDAFAYLTNLQTLDLSKNVILKLPDNIFQLGSLRKLYLSGNPLLHMSLNQLKISKPIRAPLELLDISDCKLGVLPDWGTLPQLMLYNISHNPLTTLDSLHFSAMCKLGKVDLTDSINNVKLCDMRMTISWFQEKSVYFHLDDYTRLNSKEFDNCPRLEFSDAHNASFHSCKTLFTQVANTKSFRRTWVTISGGLAGFLVGFVLLLYVMHRHNVAQTKRAHKNAKKPPAPKDVDKQSTTVLLDDVS